MLRGGLLIFPDAIGAESCPHPSPLPEGEGAVRSGAESGAILKRLRRYPLFSTTDIRGQGPLLRLKGSGRRSNYLRRGAFRRMG